NATAAARIGLKGIVMSDHGPAMEYAPPDFNISTYSFLPEYIEGIRVYRGIEANIIDYKGTVDIPDKYLKYLDYMIAGIHEVVISSGGKTKDTEAVIGALNNKHVDIIAHPDNPSYELDYEAVVAEAAHLGKLLEVNDHSFEYRKGSLENAAVFIKLCKKYGVRVAVSSDAHSAFGIGRNETAIETLLQNDFPEELVVNLTQARFDQYIEERGKRIR
ncbi:MAG: phosphatase, partial [Eubacteriales bacterium]|nr:phosphatase [Eubacteriales bacterium]